MRVPLSRGGPIVNRAGVEPSQDIAPHIDARSSHAMPWTMSDARLTHAIDRIERALDRLEDEHAHGNARIKALEDAVQRYIDGAPEGFAGFVAAFEAFADFYRDHMLREEREILPLVRKHFTADDWAAANAGFAGAADPMSGTREPREPDDFARIFSRLVAAAPAPIGLGAGPYEDG